MLLILFISNIGYQIKKVLSYLSESLKIRIAIECIYTGVSKEF